MSLQRENLRIHKKKRAKGLSLVLWKIEIRFDVGGKKYEAKRPGGGERCVGMKASLPH